MPTDYQLAKGVNIGALYCCKNYRRFAEEVKKETMILEAKAKHQLIDIAAKCTVKKRKRLSIMKTAMSFTDKSEKYRKGKIEKQKMMQSIEDLALQNAREAEEEAAAELAGPGTTDQQVDTFDLPWDPIATRYRNKHLRAVLAAHGTSDPTSDPMSMGASSRLFIQPPRATVDIDILLELEEVYTSSGSRSSGASKPPQERDI